MPNYYAHLKFGAQVLAALPQSLRVRLEGEQDAYTLGQYGPDPLFFYRSGAVHAVGVATHRQPVRPVMERLRRAVEEKRPFSAGYAAGFLCHFALDSRCHASIKHWAVDGRISHSCIESEFDRFLMVRDGVEPSREISMPAPRMPDGFYELLERYAYPGIKGRQYREGLSFYRKLCGLHTRAAGSKWTGSCLNLAARVSHQGKLLRDMVLKREAAAYARYNEELLLLLQKEVPVAEEKLTAFFDGSPLDDWFDRDFHGQT